MLGRSVQLLSLGLAVILLGCSTPRSSSPVDTSTLRSQELLAKLKACLADVHTTSDKAFASPCVHLDVTSLNGITIAQLSGTLGRSDISSDDYVNGPTTSDTHTPYEWRWAFYRLDDVLEGGGPELQCESDDRLTCTQVRWVLTL